MKSSLVLKAVTLVLSDFMGELDAAGGRSRTITAAKNAEIARAWRLCRRAIGPNWKRR